MSSRIINTWQFAVVTIGGPRDLEGCISVAAAEHLTIRCTAGHSFGRP
jgi:hypothetical protein